MGRKDSIYLGLGNVVVIMLVYFFWVGFIGVGSLAGEGNGLFCLFCYMSVFFIMEGFWVVIKRVGVSSLFEFKLGV